MPKLLNAKAAQASQIDENGRAGQVGQAGGGIERVLCKIYYPLARDSILISRSVYQSGYFLFSNVHP